MPRSKQCDFMVVGELFFDEILSGPQSFPKLDGKAFARKYCREIGSGTAITACVHHRRSIHPRVGWRPRISHINRTSGSFGGRRATRGSGAASADATAGGDFVIRAEMMERPAPKARLMNFTNPAGLVTQAIGEASRIRAAGICDTPAELPAPRFPPPLSRRIGLIPTKYAFFYYRPGLSRANQLPVGKTRGEELVLNVANGRALSGLRESDVVEINCKLDCSGINPIAQLPVPQAVLGLIESTKLVRTLLEANNETPFTY